MSTSQHVYRYTGPVGIRGNYSGRAISKETTAVSAAKAACNIRYQIAVECKLSVCVVSIDTKRMVCIK